MVMMPLKGPCTESRRSRLARLRRSSAEPLRTTAALRRNFSPLPAFSMRSRASRRPIRPKP